MHICFYTWNMSPDRHDPAFNQHVFQVMVALWMVPTSGSTKSASWHRLGPVQVQLSMSKTWMGQNVRPGPQSLFMFSIIVLTSINHHNIMGYLTLTHTHVEMNVQYFLCELNWLAAHWLHLVLDYGLYPGHTMWVFSDPTGCTLLFLGAWNLHKI